jgi:hypothetical protein
VADEGLSRRRLLLNGAAAALGGALAPGAAARAFAGPGAVAGPRAAAGVIPLPSPARIRSDFQTMVDFGPRYTGTAGHARFIDWLEREFTKAGCVMLPREEWPLTVWEASGHRLDLLDGDRAGPVPVTGYFPRSQETGPGGVTGPLIYAGAAPAPALDTGGESLQAAITAYGTQLQSWAAGLGGMLGPVPEGAIVVVDLPLPAPLAAGALVGPLATYLQWEGHTEADWLAADFKRAALLPALNAPPPSAFTQSLGAAGVVYILDASAAAIDGGYFPFLQGFDTTPALWVDRDTGSMLREAAGARPSARLTLEATRREGTSPSLLGYLPGSAGSDEAIVLNTHTDGEGFVEENGGVAMVHLARHFGSLARKDALKRSLVFTLWPGHMTTGMAGLEGVMERHPDIFNSAVAAITVEHLGATEWLDTADKGYHPTGDPEAMFCWTTQGPLFELVRDATIRTKVARTALMRPPAQFGVGSVFQGAGIPQVGFLSGPYYLVNDNKTSDMEKLDEALAAQQVAWTAEMVRRLDSADPAALMTGDPSLGAREAGPKAKFPPRGETPAEVTLTLSARRPSGGGRLHGTVTAGRDGHVRIAASVTVRRRGRTISTGLATALVEVKAGVPKPFAMALRPTGRKVLRRHRAAKVVVRARHRSGRTITRARVIAR